MPGNGYDARLRRMLEMPVAAACAVQIPAVLLNQPDRFAALQSLRDELGKQLRAGVVLYLCDQIMPFGDKLWLILLPALWAP